MNDKYFKGAVAASHSYELFNPLDLYADEIYQKKVSAVPYMSSLSWLKSIEGRYAKRRVKRSVYSYFEEGQWMKAAATIESITPSGATFNIVLSAADHQDIGGSGETSFPVENMDCLFTDGKTTGHVNTVDRTSAGAHVINVKKTNSAQDIASVALPGTTIVFFSNSQIERSGQTESRVDQYEKITNKMQIIREHFDTTDVEVQNQIWFETEPGKQYLYYTGIQNTMQRFEFQREAAHLLSNESSGLTDKNNKAIQTQYGMIPQITDHGISLEYYNKPDMAAFDEVMLALDNNYSDKSYIVGCGHNLMLKLKDFMVQFAQNGTGNISFSPFSGGQEQAISLKFKSYSVGAYEFYFQQWDIFSHKDSLGAPGLPYRHKGVFIPAGVTRNADPNRAADSPVYEPYLQLVGPVWGVPLKKNIDKGDYVMFETGAFAAQGPTSDVLEVGVHAVAWQGTEMKCRHKFLQWDLA